MARIALPSASFAPHGDDSAVLDMLDSMGHDSRAILAAIDGDTYCAPHHVEAWNDAVARILAGEEEEGEE